MAKAGHTKLGQAPSRPDCYIFILYKILGKVGSIGFEKCLLPEGDKRRRLTGAIPVVCHLGSSFQLVNHRFDRRQFLGISHSAYNAAQPRLARIHIGLWAGIAWQGRC